MSLVVSALLIFHKDEHGVEFHEAESQMRESL